MFFVRSCFVVLSWEVVFVDAEWGGFAELEK